MVHIGWERLFQDSQDDHISATTALKEQLLEVEDEVFEDFSHFKICRFHNGVPEEVCVKDAAQFSAVSQKRDFGFTVVSICSNRTNAPLKISSELAYRMFSSYSVRIEFLRVMLSFGRGPQETDANDGLQYFHTEEPNDCEPFISVRVELKKLTTEDVISYKLNYIEKNKRDPNSWSYRHIGIYHHHQAQSDLIILLNCTESTSFLEHFKSINASSKTMDRLLTNKDFLRLKKSALEMHLMLISRYYDNWKAYLGLLGSRLSRVNDHAMVVSTDRIGQESFEKIQSLRHIHDLIMFADACCEGNVRIVQGLVSINFLSKPQTQALEIVLASLARSRASSQAMQKRVLNAIDMIGYMLTIYNHKEIRNLAQENRDLTVNLKDLAQETSLVTRKLQELTQVTVDDSAFVNVITIVSAVYIPGGFVASIFGMNFFDFNGDTQSIMIGKDFWIFIVIWLLLIVLTGGLFIAIMWVKKRNSGPRRRDHTFEKDPVSRA